MGSSSFFELWKQLTPFIVTAKPMTDLCWTCQLNNQLIYKGVNIAEEDKSSRLRSQEEHLRIVQAERSVYNGMVDDSKATCRSLRLTQLQQNIPCSHRMSMHYSFDCAQQVHLPSNPLQPGPIYFLVPRKCGLFGVCCEGLPQQINFVIDEAHLIIKVPMQLSHIYTFSLRTVDWERLMCSFTSTIVQERTRIASFCGTARGELPQAYIIQFLSTSSLQDTQNLRWTGVSVCQNRLSDATLCRPCRSSRL